MKPVRSPPRVTVAFGDVTAQNDAQEALLASEAKFRGILESAPDAMVISDSDGLILLINAETQRLFGYSRAELVGQAVEVLVPELFRANHPGHRHSYTAHPRTRSMGEGLGLRGLRKDNTEFPVEISLSPIETPEGTLISCAIRDVTARKQAAEELRISEERFRLLVNGAKDYAIFMLDAAGHIVSWNTGAERIKGYRSEEILGRHFSCFYPPDDIESGKPTKELEIAAATGRFEEEGWRIRKNGSRFWADVTISALRDSSGKLEGFAKVSRDGTARREAQEALRHREALERRAMELKRSNDDLQQFAYIAAHDLQEPLRMVASYTQLLAQRYKGRLDSDADEFIGYAVDGAHRMRLLIGDLLAYCRVGTTGKELDETSSLAALEQAVLNLQSAINDSGAVITQDPLPIVFADGVQLVQLFQNLVGNAIKYRSLEPPRVHISARKNSVNELIFSVRDNGLGIDPQHFEKIFVMFQRLHGRGEFSGTGIGLTLCKKIVERHGGRIWVESDPGKGSTFYFSLPERAME